MYMCETCNLYLCSSVSPCDAECWTRKSCAVLGAAWHAVIHMYFCMPGLSHMTTDSSRFQQSDSDFHNEKWWNMWVSFECHRYFGNLWNLPAHENEGSEVTVKYIMPSPVGQVSATVNSTTTKTQQRKSDKFLWFRHAHQSTDLRPHHSVCMCVYIPWIKEWQSNNSSPYITRKIVRYSCTQWGAADGQSLPGSKWGWA